MTPHPLKPGDLVVTPTNRHGRIVRSPRLMPYHALIAFDCGALLWMPHEILQPAVAASPSRQRKQKVA